MTSDQLKNLGRYALAALVGACVTTGLHLAQILAGTDPILFRPLAATFTLGFFGALATALGTSQFGRLGSEGISSQVKALQAEGVPRSEMAVLTKEEVERLRDEAARLNRIAPLRAAQTVAEQREAGGSRG